MTTCTARPQNKEPFFFIRHQGCYLKIQVADIHYIEARKNYCRIVTHSGTFQTIVTLKRMAEILPPDTFCRIRRKFIVSLDWITTFDETTVSGKGMCLPIGEMYHQGFVKRLRVIGGDDPEKKIAG
jgi:DNA-binding LytR/AlgR family response regulator